MCDAVKEVALRGIVLDQFQRAAQSRDLGANDLKIELFYIGYRVGFLANWPDGKRHAVMCKGKDKPVAEQSLAEIRGICEEAAYALKDWRERTDGH